MTRPRGTRCRIGSASTEMLTPQLDAYTVIGLTVGGALSLAALGIVLVYRVTGVLNFANGAMGMFSTFVAWQVIYPLPRPIWLGVLAALIFSVAMGLALELFVFRWLVGRPQLVK